jgi:AhpD family alkylhydroperoxidase
MSQFSSALKPSFNKRIYTFPAFKADVRQIFDHMDDLRRAARGGRVNKAFAEKIMLVVSSVNGCRYCCYGHSKAALAAGVSETELQSLLALDLGTFPLHEVTALAFAQHYADTNGQPDHDAWQRVVDNYGEETARDILAYLRMITFGSLLGNTFDALLSRISGKPAAGSSLWGELNVLVGALWMPPSRLLLGSLNREKSGLNEKGSVV